MFQHSIQMLNRSSHSTFLMMPRTEADKCKSFTSGITTCTCINNYVEKLPPVITFFEKEVKEFWKSPSCVAVCIDGVAVGKHFVEYFYPVCSFASERAGYIFLIDGQDMIFCLPNLTCMYELGQHAHTSARIILMDRKAIIWISPRMLLTSILEAIQNTKLLRFYRSCLNYKVVPVIITIQNL